VCGLVGFYFSNSAYDLKSSIKPALKSLRHRGPDDSGVWVDKKLSIALGHTRLSIHDLSSSGSQPMVSPSKRYILVFNGEIYNYLELRQELDKLQKISWRGSSDTEVLLCCIDVFGIERALKKATGMFSFALWDVKERSFILARDRFGEKPMYYGFSGKSFVFSSELKAIKSLPTFVNTIDRDAIASFMQYSYVPTPQCIYNGLYKLPAGTWISVSLSQISDVSLPSPKRYWSAIEKAVEGESNQYSFSSDNDAVDQLEFLLKKSIKSQMLSDVPIGAFLSGGVDSSTVVSIMQSLSNKPINTFSIGYGESEYNEAKDAKKIANHLGTNHTELYIESKDALNVIPKISEIYDEPFADYSQIPTYLVSELAKSKVSVTLSGDGGDELFGGYNRYQIPEYLKKINKIPRLIQGGISKGINLLSIEQWNSVYGFLSAPVHNKYRYSLFGDKLYKFDKILTCESDKQLYGSLIKKWNNNELVKNGSSLDFFWKDLESSEASMMLADTVGYMSDDILTKVDRAAMSVSLETRVPMLNHEIYEFACKLPNSYKHKSKQGKWILRELLYRRIPKELTEGTKKGFTVPIDDWLRGPLRGWASDLLSESRIELEGYLEPGLIQSKWKEHLSEKHNWGADLWNILMFESWLKDAD